VPDDAAALRERWGTVLLVREQTNAVLEAARAVGQIGKSQEARLIVSADEVTAASLAAAGPAALAEALIVSEVAVQAKGAEQGADEASERAIEVTWTPATGEKCPRCWNWRAVGADGLCERCSAVVRGL